MLKAILIIFVVLSIGLLLGLFFISFKALRKVQKEVSEQTSMELRERTLHPQLKNKNKKEK